MIAVKVIARGEQLVIRSAQALDDRVAKALVTGLARGLQYAAGIAQREFLSGPRPAKLDVRTARLRNSIATSVTVGKERIVGRIGSNVKYAAVHEFGFHGVMQVKAHTRVTGQFNHIGKAVDTRRSFVDRAGKFIGFRDTRKRAAGAQKSGCVQVGFVRSHSRKLNYAGRPYIAPALAKTDFAAELRQELETLKNG